MASKTRRAGLKALKVGNNVYDVKGNVTYNLGGEMKEGMAGADRVHGYKVTRIVPKLEGQITDRGDLDVAAFKAVDGETVVMELENGKTVFLKDAWFAGEGEQGTEEGNIDFKFEGLSGREIRAA